MATVLRINGLRVVVYSHDHPQPHVHIESKDRTRTAVFYLNCPNGPPELRENYGFKLKTLNAVAAVLDDQLDYLCGEWRRIHGEP